MKRGGTSSVTKPNTKKLKTAEKDKAQEEKEINFTSDMYLKNKKDLETKWTKW